MQRTVFDHLQRQLDQAKTPADFERILVELRQHDREDPDVSAIAEHLAMVRRIPGDRAPGDRSDKFMDSGEGVIMSDSSRWTCARKHSNSPTCDAFPERIPNAILDGEHDHLTPYAGDHGLLYVPIDA